MDKKIRAVTGVALLVVAICATARELPEISSRWSCVFDDSGRTKDQQTQGISCEWRATGLVCDSVGKSHNLRMVLDFQAKTVRSMETIFWSASDISRPESRYRIRDSFRTGQTGNERERTNLILVGEDDANPNVGTLVIFGTGEKALFVENTALLNSPYFNAYSGVCHPK